jgi:serine/threonine protein kinase
MALIEGKSLADCLHDGGPLPVHRAAEIAIEMIEALDVAHQRGVLHRDIKPSNIMIDKDDRVVLTDFGIAVIDGATALTGTGQLIGAPEYIAPERIDGHEATHAADLWAVGVTLYSMVVGRTPFHRSDTSATFAAIVSREADPDPAVGSLWPVIQGLLRKKPAERLTAAAALGLLREVVGKPAAAPPVGRNLPKVEGPPTMVWDPGSQATVTNATVPVTRISTYRPAPPSDATQPVVLPWDITGDYVPPPNSSVPRNRGPWIVGIAVAAVIAVIVIVVLANTDHGTGNAAPPLPAFTAHQEQLGFSIAIPDGYNRQASSVSAQSDVVWQAPQPDPRIGPLLIQVLRDDTPGITPYHYLSARDRTESADSNNVGYQRVSLTGQNNGPAELEYTYSTAASGNRYRVRTRAVTSGNRVYVLTFTLYAQDATTLGTQWLRLQPIMEKVRNSFQVAP